MTELAIDMLKQAFESADLATKQALLVEFTSASTAAAISDTNRDIYDASFIDYINRYPVSA